MRRVIGLSKAALRQHWKRMSLLSGEKKVGNTVYLLPW